MKALILSAGEGRRLRPLTESRPKPLIEFFGNPILSYALEQIAQIGLEDLAINTHYLASFIHDFTITQKIFKKIHISHEPEILGTGGALLPLRPWIKNDSLLIANGDVVANFDWQALIHHHQNSNAVATLVLLPRTLPDESVLYVKNGLISQIGGLPKHVPDIAQSGDQVTRHCFACAQILTPSFFDLLNSFKGHFSIIDVYRFALAQGLKIASFVHEEFWADIGTPSRYFDAHKEYFKSFLARGLDPLGVQAKVRKQGQNLVINGSFPETYRIKPNLVTTEIPTPSTTHLGSVARELGPDVFIFKSGLYDQSWESIKRTIICSDACIDNLPNHLDNCILSGNQSVTF